MIETFLVRPIFNVLTFIYGVIPGHNLGLAIIIFTIVVRMVMWPLVKKQLYHAKAMRELQPEIRKIKQQTKGDRRKESMMVMALYKERELNPFAPIGVLLLQLPVLLALYAVLRRIIDNPQSVIDFSYDFVRNLPSIKELAGDVAARFDTTLFGFVDLKRRALGEAGIYWPAMVIALAGSAVQYYQSKQLTVSDENARTIRQIFRDTASGKQVDNAEVNAAMGRNMRLIIPVFMFLLTISIASGLSLYLLVTGVVAYIQQSYILGRDKKELEVQIDGQPVTATVVSGAQPKTKKQAHRKKPTRRSKTKRRG
jgi:YidC/Oxa1 family membrane protein insertase